jgi:hypothetical protein
MLGNGLTGDFCESLDDEVEQLDFLFGARLLS